jgi:hypothetical protein
VRAVEEFSDCFYPDGCQVGGYGRYLLASVLWNSGKEAQARKRIEELKTQYPDAIARQGVPLRLLVEELESKWAEQE